jgi:hypothetical protein
VYTHDPTRPLCAIYGDEFRETASNVIGRKLVEQMAGRSSEKVGDAQGSSSNQLPRRCLGHLVGGIARAKGFLNSRCAGRGIGQSKPKLNEAVMLLGPGLFHR